ncbi:tetrapyrrole methylase [Pilobolus umbonatus]|nr:tetrapyrrole methylase [Pilobolus umbonatus]
MTLIPVPQGGASLMIAYQTKHVLVIGHNSIAANRVLSSLEADATVYLLYSHQERLCPELVYRIDHQQVKVTHDLDCLKQVRFDLGFICESMDTMEETIQLLREYRVPVNVTDRGDLSDFFMTSTYRDQSVQIAVSTNGQASKLSNRIRRHISSHLPARLGDAVKRVGVLRKKLKASDGEVASKVRRMKWLAQMCEYWSMEKLAELTDAEMEGLLDTYHEDEGYESAEVPKGSLCLVGSGTGDPDLLTVAAVKAIENADLVLADKIVPAEIIALVKCELKIARKYPGHAEEAQKEFNQMALKAVQQGRQVVRLKQGDPYLFGRGGEEVLFFRQYNIVPHVIPGISSTVAAPLLAGIPLTHRSVASQFLVTTGTGANNSSTPLPVFQPHRTDVFLMAIHRLKDLVRDLINKQSYPPTIPCAIIERASCKDQRVIWGPLENIVDILESCGGSRPPGLLVIGHAIHVLKSENKGNQGVADTLNTITSLVHHPNTNNLLPLHDPESIC